MTAQTSIGANDGRIQSTVAAGELGPFAIDFPFFALDDVMVTITAADGTITSYVRGVDYNISATANDDGIYPSGTVNWLGGGIPVAGTLTRYRLTGLERNSQLPLTGFLNRQALNADLNRLACAMQDFDRKVSSALRYPEEDGIAANVLQPAAQRVGLQALFDSQGRLYAGTLQAGITAGSPYSLTTLLPLADRAAWRTALSFGALDLNNVWLAGTLQSFALARILVPTRTTGDNGTDAASTAFVQAALTAGLGGAVLRSYLAGLNTSNNAGTPNSKIDVTAGICADGTNAAMLVYAGGTLDCGTVGANGLDAGALANSTWYFLWLIGKTDGTTALLASTSSTAPTMPTGYTLKRLIWAFKTDGSAHIIGYTQDGDYCRWKASVRDINANNPGTGAVTATLASVPTGLNVLVTMNLMIGVSTTPSSVYLSEMSANDEVPSGNNVPGITLANNVGSTTQSLQVTIRTNTSAQVRYRMGASAADVTLIMIVLGWSFRRGRDG